MMDIARIWRRFTELYESRHEPEYVRPLTEILWRALLTCAGVAMFCIVLFAASEFWSVIGSLTAPPTTVSQPQTFDRTSLEQTLGDVQARKSSFDELKNNPPPVVDPSK